MTSALSYDSAPAVTGWRPRLWARAARGTWVSHRSALAALAGVTVAFAVVIAVRAVPANAANAKQALNCVGQLVSAPCVASYATLASAHTWAYLLGWFLLVLPLIAGVFMGAPLVAREVESGSYRFLWTQGSGRVRFGWRRLVLLAVGAAACACVLGLCLGWLVHPLQAAQMNTPWDARLFNSTVVTLPAWTFFSLALGTFVGALVRRTVASMAVTAVLAGGLLLFAGAPSAGSAGSLTTRLVGLDPVTVRTPKVLWGAQGMPGTRSGFAPSHSWVVQSWLTSPGGRRYYGSSVWNTLFDRHPAAARNPSKWLAAHHFTSWYSYQPGDRFWTFEGLLAGALVIVAALLCWATFRLIRRMG